MAKGSAKKEQTAKDYEKLYDTWLNFSKNINERIMELAKKGRKEYEELYKVWSDYAQKMTDKLATFSPEDKGAFKEMQNVWTDYSNKIGERFVDLLSKKEGPHKELYELYSNYSEKMSATFSELMSETIKEQKDLYELWMDAFGMKDKNQIEGISSALGGVGQFWLDLWERSRNVIIPTIPTTEGKVDYTAVYKELNDFWTKTYSKMIMNLIGSQAFAEMSGTILDRNLEMIRLNEQFMNQYLSALGLPTKESMNDIFRKLHDLDRKVSELARRIESTKTANKK